MIKSIFQITVFLILFHFCKSQVDNKAIHTPNYIDSIQTAKQIEELILKIDKRYSKFKVNQTLNYESNRTDINCKRISDSLEIKPWQKADFDNNGLSDILIVGTWTDHHILCVLDKGENHYEIKSITRRSFQECTFPVVSNNKIKYYFESHLERENWDKPRKLEQINLIYQFGDFIEENPMPKSHKIDKIEYSTTSCFGTCAIFKLTINSDKTAKWFADKYNEVNDKEVKGDFNSTITEDRYTEIISLLNYIGFAKLKDNYAVTWTDDQSSTLIITYDNGKTKSINDYGLIGTYGLDRVYQMLFELRTNQKWEN
jgi:hypothetical protein